jgi:hypothetical protein
VGGEREGEGMSERIFCLTCGERVGRLIFYRVNGHPVCDGCRRSTVSVVREESEAQSEGLEENTRARYVLALLCAGVGFFAAWALWRIGN